MAYLTPGHPAYRQAIIALFSGSFVTFAVLYCTQPLIPVLSQHFQITPAAASLSLSVTTMPLAVSMVIAAILSDRLGRKHIMAGSLLASAILALVAALCDHFTLLLAVRALQGLALAGFPAIAMAYVEEEVAPQYTGLVIGLYISGTAVGGMSGRLVVGALTDWFGWQAALGGIGCISLAVAVWFWRHLPPSQHFTPKPRPWSALLPGLARTLRQPGLPWLYAIAFLVMGSFVTLYNYIAYPLLAPPYSLSQTAVGSVFLLYLVGTVSSTVVGRLADRYPRRRVLWSSIAVMLLGALITVTASLAGKIIGMAVFTFGFFGSHSVASSTVGQWAGAQKAQAASLYLLFYYTGSSVLGTSGGFCWSHYGWGGVIALVCTALVAAAACSLCLPSTAANAEQHRQQQESSLP